MAGANASLKVLALRLDALGKSLPCEAFKHAADEHASQLEQWRMPLRPLTNGEVPEQGLANLLSAACQLFDMLADGHYHGFLDHGQWRAGAEERALQLTAAVPPPAEELAKVQRLLERLDKGVCGDFNRGSHRGCRGRSMMTNLADLQGQTTLDWSDMDAVDEVLFDFSRARKGTASQAMGMPGGPCPSARFKNPSDATCIDHQSLEVADGKKIRYCFHPQCKRFRHAGRFYPENEYSVHRKCMRGKLHTSALPKEIRAMREAQHEEDFVNHVLDV